MRNFVGIPTSNRRSRITINLLLNVYRNILARLSIAYPSVTVLPASPSTEDIEKAQASETMLRYYWHTEDMKSIITTLMEWLLVTGNGALHTYYDPADERVHTRAVSPYDVFFEPGATSVSESRWVAIRSIVVKEDLIKAYPDKKDIIEKSTSAPDRSMRALFKRTTGTEGVELKDRLEVYEVYTADGGLGVLLGTNWLYKCDWPTKSSPITFFQYTNIPGRLWGMGLIEPLIELQTMYNRGRTQIIENAELMGNPKWLIPKSSGVGKDALSDSRPGEKVVYNANSGPAPQQIPAAPFPSYVLDNIKQLSAELLDVAGVHSTSLGKRAIGIESGAAIQSLANKDSQQLQVTQNNIETGIKEVSACVLEMARAYYNEPRLMRMLDETGRVVHQTLGSTDITEDPEVYIEAGTLFRDEKQDRDQKVLEMVQLGLLTKDEALQELDYRTGNARITRRMAGFSHAHDMLDAIKMGQAIEIMPTDDLQAFGEVFETFMKTHEYYQLSEDVQQYIRDVLIAVATFGKEDAQFEEAQLQRTVFPRQISRPEDTQRAMATLGSPATASQMGSDFENMEQRRGLTDEGGPEAGVSRVMMGGSG
tara:strand:- start:3286 stop:5067 length:1782 start_codon:yes stop_codon:yes gene_type:complete